MRNEQNAVLASLRRTQQYLDTHGDVLDAVNKSTRRQLDAVVTQLTDLSTAQETGVRGAKGETARQHALRLVLRRNYMTPIAAVAKLELRAVPEFASLMMPIAGGTTERLVAAAYAMADAAAPHADVLIDNGLPETFADDLRTAAAAVSESTAGRTKYQGTRVGATAGLAAGERRGRAIIKVLNALITRRIGNDAQLVAEWKSAKAVGRKPGPSAGRGHAVDVTPIHPAEGGATPATAAVMAAA
ncbi:MAG TPA: hypothetical protein VK636_07800 [Gemmatimonadaceae bacterium]|nr:hypothetical protein [Gemmatimonadaceae bacterium]